METKADKVQAAVDFVVNTYTDTKRPVTTRDVAEGLGVTPSTAKRWLDSAFGVDGGWVRIVPTTTHIDVRDSNYGGVISSRRVEGWKPQTDYLADERARYLDALIAAHRYADFSQCPEIADKVNEALGQ